MASDPKPTASTMKRILLAFVLLYALSDSAIAAPGSNQNKTPTRRFLEKNGSPEFRSSGRPIGTSSASQKARTRKRSTRNATSNRRRSAASASTGTSGRPLRISSGAGRISGRPGNVSGNDLRFSGSQPARTNITSRGNAPRLR